MALFKRQNSFDADTRYFLNSFRAILSAHPIQVENFLDSFAHLCQLFKAVGGSLYLYEQKTNVFVLHKTFGLEPDRLSISGDYEFLHMVKTRDGVIAREEFLSAQTHELRSSALLYFQHTQATHVCPVRSQGQWLGLIHLNLPAEGTGLSDFCTNLVELYADAMSRWIHYQIVAQKNRQLSDIAHVKEQLLNNVTHEFNTPLNGVLGGCDLLGDDLQLNEDQKRAVQMIRHSAGELQKTIDQILKFVQIEAKKSRANQDKVDLFVLMNEVTELYQAACSEKKIALRLPQTKESFFVSGQPDQLRTVFMNLIGNAVKFTEQGFVSVTMQKTADWVSVAIADSGIGIDAEKLHLIFEEFYQADGSHTRVYGGTGLGLAIVKKIISLHGGKIWVESQKGSGSEFKFVLPIYPI